MSRVIEVLEGSVAPVECVDNAGLCARSDECATRDVWSDIKAAIMGVLESLTVKDLMERQKAKSPSKSETYSI